MGALRCLLALAIVNGHVGGIFGWQMIAGDAAVQAFYVVSGFYMTLVLSEKYGVDTAGRRRFWLSRYMRLAPAYLAISAAALATGIARTGGAGVLAGADPAALALAILSNLALIGQDLFVFVGYDTAAGRFLFLPDILRGGLARAGPAVVPGWSLMQIPQGWSIGVEIWFYLLAPFLVTRRIGVVLGVMAASFLLRLALAKGLGWKYDPWTYRFFPSELLVFLTGSLAYRAYARLKGAPSLDSAGWAALAAVIGLGLLYPWLPGGGADKRWIYVTIVALALAPLFALTRGWAADRWIGELSYPIYLSHLLILSWLAPVVEPWRGLATLVLTLALSAAIMVGIEKPVDRLRQRLAAPAFH